jgi:hypothetical protein
MKPFGSTKYGNGHDYFSDSSAMPKFPVASLVGVGVKIRQPLRTSRIHRRETSFFLS